MNNAENYIQSRLNERTIDGSLRKLISVRPPIDFCSNDYLGFASSHELRKAVELEMMNASAFNNGSGGSRLLSGNTAYIEETEAFISDFHHAESGLIFNSGYDANVGLLSCLAQKGDTFICDELIHASLIDGARLTHANRYTFRHNDIVQLEEKLKVAKGIVYVVVESVYSMDGDMAALLLISELCETYHANLIVDEAHATGVFGQNGKGLVQALHLEQKVFARVVTFGKALGCHGAIVLGSHNLKQYLINFARPFIYTTAAPIHTLFYVKSAYKMLIATDYTPQIKQKIAHYAELLIAYKMEHAVASPSAIQTLIVPGNANAKDAAAKLQTAGFDVRAILSPTVPLGKERIRICLHLYNTDQEIEKLVLHLKELNLQ
ncbi:MAG: aminotransferase class I/II-fold pyridoxal phosphate-dependent enzyme [Pedobacter sp.]